MRFEEKGEGKRYMKQCVVCGAEIKTELEEFGDPREPVCAPCWLYGYQEEPPKLVDGRPVPRVREQNLFGKEG